MKMWKSLSVLAVASALTASIPSARALASESALPQSVFAEPRSAVVAIRGYDLDGSPRVVVIEQTERPILRGHVAEVDADSGQVIVATERGLLNLVISPEDAERVQVGDVMLLALMTDESD
jgi:hypothetical protein